MRSIQRGKVQVGTPGPHQVAARSKLLALSDVNWWLGKTFFRERMKNEYKTSLFKKKNRGGVAAMS